MVVQAFMPVQKERDKNEDVGDLQDCCLMAVLIYVSLN